MRKGLSAIFIAAVLIESSVAACFAGNQAVLLRVMPVSSWGATAAPDYHPVFTQASNTEIAPHPVRSGRTASLAGSATGKGTISTSGSMATAHTDNKDLERAMNFLDVASKQLTKEGGKRLGVSSQWLASLFKSQPPPHLIAPASPVTTVSGLVHAQPVSGKHPLWLLPNGRLKSVTLQ